MACTNGDLLQTPGESNGQAKCNRVIRIDHSQKFCSKLKRFGAKSEKEQAASMRLLLLVQNEVGQIIARRLTRSESHVESAAILQSVVPKMAVDVDPAPVCVCDNANKTRSLVMKVFGPRIQTKQDPFHLIQRFSEKIIDKPQRKALSKQLSMAMYDLAGNIRSPEAMEKRFLATLQQITPSNIRTSTAVWENCIAINLEQIRNGDSYVKDNEYLEAGTSIRIVSTSQLEAVHSKLRKLLDRVLSIEVGLRILDIVLLRHNLKAGAKYKRNPPFIEYDFITLSQTAVFCRGLLPESPQVEFVYQLLSTPTRGASVMQRFRPGGEDFPANRPWERLYNLLSLSTATIEASMLRNRTLDKCLNPCTSNEKRCRSAKRKCGPDSRNKKMHPQTAVELFNCIVLQQSRELELGHLIK